MILLEDLYTEVVLNERLQDINISDDEINQDLLSSYEEYRDRMRANHPKKQINIPNQRNDANMIKDVLALASDYDKTFSWVIKDFLRTNHKKKLEKSIVQLDKAWKANIGRSATGWSQTNQPVNIAFFKIIERLGLDNFPIRYNDEGWPVYPKHLLNKYIGMNLLEQLFEDGEITPEQKTIIDDILLDDATKKIIGYDIENYLQRTNIKLPPEPEPEPESRLDMIRRLAQKN